MKTLKRTSLLFLQMIALIAITSSVKAQLKADFSATPQTGCPPMVVSFNDLSTGNPTYWKWELGNGTISYLKNPVATYFNPGSYNVKLIVKNATGADSVIKSQFITVNALPTPNFVVSDSTGCFPLNIKFFDSSIAGSGNIVSWQWDFGDGTLSNLQNPTHTYTNAGTYTVILNVRNSKGCSKAITRQSYIKIQNGVKANFSHTSPVGCISPAQVSFTDNSVGTGQLSYLWNFGDGKTSTLQNPVHNYVNEGTYTVQLIVTNSTGCKDTITKVNAVNVKFPVAKFTSIDSICAGVSFNLTNTSTPNSVGATWYFGDGTSLNAINGVKTYTAPGTYQVKMVNNFGSCLDSVFKTIKVLSVPVADFTGNNVIGCSAPLNVQFSNLSTGGNAYLWNFGTGTTSTFQNPSHNYTTAGSYNVSLTVTNINGCKSTKVVNNLVNVIPPKIVGISGLRIKECLPYAITPKANIQSVHAVTSYFWDFGDGITSTDSFPSHTYTKPGKFNVKLVITTAGGCKDSIVISDAAIVGNKPKAAFSANPREICVFSEVEFKDLSTGRPIHEWFWDFGDGVKSTDSFPKHKYCDTGYMKISLVVFSFGCGDTLKVDDYIYVKPPIARYDTLFNCNEPLKRTFKDTSAGATSWFWSFGDGNTSIQRNPVHNYAQPGTYVVSLKVTNGVCSDELIKDIVVVKEKGRLVLSDTSLCKNVPLSLSVSNIGSANISSYAWYFNGLQMNPVVNNSNPFSTGFLTTGPRNPMVIVKDILNCPDTLYSSSVVNIYGPVAKFSSQVAGTCLGNTVNFFDSSYSDGKHPILNYKWTYGDGTVQNLNNGPFSHNYSSIGTYTVKLVVTDSYGCKDSLTNPSTITITKPVANFTSSDTMICEFGSISFTNKSQALNAQYNWIFGDGKTSTAESPVHAFEQEGTYTVKLFVTDLYGCSDSITKTIRVYNAKASFILSDSFSTCPPLIVNISNKSTNYVAINWDFGDGGNSQLENPSHIYTYPGTYYVKLTVRNNGGCIDTLTKKIEIGGPTGVLNYGPKTLCNPGKVDFECVAQNTVKYIWDYNDGSTVINTNSTSSHLFNSPGYFLPRIILEDALGCKVPVMGLDTIKINGIETAILSSVQSLCDSGYVNFSEKTITNDVIAGFTWDFGDGTFSTLPNPTHFYKKSGTYNVSLIASSSFGCKDTAVYQAYIKVHNSPKVSIIGDTSACEPAQLKFQGGFVKTDTASVNWLWNFGNSQTANTQNPGQQLYSNAGNYPVSLIVTNNYGCADTVIRTATIHPKPQVDAGLDTTVCRFSGYTLTPSGASTYVWNASPTLSCTTCPNPVALPRVKSTYYVTGTSIYGCTNTDSVVLQVKQPIKMKVEKGDTLCFGSTTQLKASGAELYNWFPALWLDNPTIANPKSKPDSTIKYRVIGKDDHNCFFDTGYVTLKVYPIPQIEIKNGDVINLQVGNTVKLETKNSPDITQWKWFPGQALSCVTCPEPMTSTRESITYTVTASNPGNCTSRDQVTVNVVCGNANIYVPNTFTPNGDGVNDIFYPRGTGVYSVKNFRIFNRWGQVVFEKSNVTPNNPSQGWDGTMNGIPMASDVYVYMIEVVCENNIVFPFKGNLTLLR